MNRISLTLSALLTLAAAYQLALLTWALVSPPEPAVEPPALIAPPAPAAQPVALARLQQAALFGSADQPEPVSKPVVQPAQKSRLALKLLGIVQGSATGSSVAIIDERGKQRAYSAGEPLASVANAVLFAIERERVVIEVNGRHEFIELEAYSQQPEGQGVVATPSQPLPERISLNQPDVRRLVGDYRAKLVADPLSFGRFVQLQPHDEGGQVLGYRLSPGKDRRLFDVLGLQEGDTVTHVGGLDVSDPANLPRLLGLLSSGEAQLTLGITRAGQAQEIDVEL